MSIYYYQAEVIFPEWFRKNRTRFRKNPGTLNGDLVSFTLDELSVNARLIWQEGFYPEELRKRQVQTSVIQPVANAVRKDIDTIDDLFRELGELAKSRGVEGIEDKFLYLKEPFYKRYFGVIDMMKTCPFKTLGEFKARVLPVLTDEDQELLGLSSFFSNTKDFLGREGIYAYVHGETLREATERALKIYSLRDRL